MEKQQKNNQTEDVVYTKPKLWKRCFSILVDVFLLGVTSALLFVASNAIAVNTPGYSAVMQKRNEIQVGSGLFTEDGTDIVTYASNSSELATTRQKKVYVCGHLNFFYQNPDFFSSYPNEAYEGRKASATSGGVSLFIVDGATLVENPSASLDDLYSFYCTEANTYAIPQLYNSVSYVETTRYVTIVSGVEILLCITLSYFLYYLVFPLWVFKRGRKTLGRAVFHIGLVGADALNVSKRKTVGRFFFTYGVYFLLGFVAFTLPILVSAGMLFISRRSQDLADYVLNVYMVDTTNCDIYMDYGDYLTKGKTKSEASIKNRNFRIDNHGL